MVRRRPKAAGAVYNGENASDAEAAGAVYNGKNASGAMAAEGRRSCSGRCLQWDWMLDSVLNAPLAHSSTGNKSHR